MNKMKRIIPCFCLAFLLSQCVQNNVMVNEELPNPYPDTATNYLAKAKEAVDTEQQALMVKAAGRLVEEGKTRQATRILRKLKSLAPELYAEKQLLLARIDLMRGNPRTAIARLARVNKSEVGDVYYQIAYHQLLARAYQRVNNPINSIEERIKLEALLPNEGLRGTNRQALWNSLMKLSPATLTSQALEAEDGSELEAWLQLAIIPRKYRSQPFVMLSEIKQWRRQHPNHPGNAVLPASLDSVDKQLSPQPQNVALLLPLTGPVSGPGKAIRDGFMAAYYKNRTLKKVRFYDTNKTDAQVLYQQALEQGADYIIGPLLKNNVKKVAKLNIQKNTLALNDIDGHAQSRFFEFGLSPVDEAQQVAIKARHDGLTKALIIAPQGRWGDDITKAFVRQWTARGGMVVDGLRYAQNQDLNQAVKQLLHISESKQREQQIKRLLGRKIKFIARRRQDFDMVFLLAYPSAARTIQPLLKFYYAGNVPVYATSNVYAGVPDPTHDRDLDGIIFCDMPWVLKNPALAKKVRWPEQLNGYGRLYALGLDSYSLASELNQLFLFPAMGVDDSSGLLHLGNNNHITRMLEWARFSQGKPERLS